MQAGSAPYIDKLLVTLPSLIRHTGQMGVPLFAVLAHHAAVVVRVLSEESLRVIVAVDVDLSQGIVGSRFFTSLMNTSLQPGQQQFESGMKSISGSRSEQVFIAQEFWA